MKPDPHYLPAGVRQHWHSELSLDQGLVRSYEQADTALYRAKQGGKNQIQVALASQAVAE